jgi:hypothetical protein
MMSYFYIPRVGSFEEYLIYFIQIIGNKPHTLAIALISANEQFISSNMESAHMLLFTKSRCMILLSKHVELLRHLRHMLILPSLV